MSNGDWTTHGYFFINEWELQPSRSFGPSLDLICTLKKKYLVLLTVKEIYPVTASHP